jgi:tetratricopeptide (TPR) repeat protein
VLGSTPLRGEDKIKELVLAQKYDSLNATELYHLGYVIPGLDNKLMIANYYNKRFPGDWRMHNDKAVVLMALQKYQEAMASLEEADKINPNNSTVWHNMGVCYMYNNMRNKAADAFTKAGSNYALGLIAIQRGNYTDAIAKFNNANEPKANIALAYLLNKQPEEAKKILEKIAPDNQNSYSYYMMAIVGARMNNAELMSTNLTRSIQKAKDEGMDLSAVKKYAAEDLEFRAFFDNPLFQAAVK